MIITNNLDGTRSRWSVYANSDGNYIILKEIIDNTGVVESYTYTHAIKDEDDLEAFLKMITNREVDELFR